MRIRRYCGHDCESVNGFNNGYYIDDDYIEVKDIDDAFEKCKEYLETRWDTNESDIEEWDNGYQLITSYNDNDGNDIKPDDYDSDKHEYSYVFVTYEEEIADE